MDRSLLEALFFFEWTQRRPRTITSWLKPNYCVRHRLTDYAEGLSRLTPELKNQMKYSIGFIRSAPAKPPIFLRSRSSEVLIISTVALAIYTDIFLYGVGTSVSLNDSKEIIPIIPFALESRVGIPHDSVQSSVSILLAVYAAGLIAASPIVGWAAGILVT